MFLLLILGTSDIDRPLIPLVTLAFGCVFGCCCFACDVFFVAIARG